MKKYSKRRMGTTFVVLLLVLCISIGYAVLTTVLNINSSIALGKASFAIHFDNVETASHKATVNTEAAITNDEKTIISFDVGIPRIGDYYRFTTDIVNEGSIPGKVKSIELNGLTDSQRRLIKYKVTYTGSDKQIVVGDYFGPNSSRNMTVEVIYELSEDVENDDLPTDTLNLECEFVINFENGTIEEYRSRAASSKLSQDAQYMSSKALSFTRPTSASEYQGLYVLDSTKDDDFPIYFYRGGQDVANNVLFSNYCWRIIRTTNTGGIKMIYNGTPTEDGYCNVTTGANTVLTTMEYGSYNGYNATAVKTYIESWYFSNIIKNQVYVEDTPFCNGSYDGDGDINLSCASDKTYSLAKDNIAYPIGLLTAQEANLCGLTTSTSTYAWLYAGVDYWTMTANSHYNDYLWRITSAINSGSLYRYGTYLHSMGVRPVISLNSEVVLTDGDGTTTNPYKVRLG